LSELERELEALEGERNESLLALQESRQVLEVREREKLAGSLVSVESAVARASELEGWSAALISHIATLGE
jgi:predicted NUDIX family phosphoesterase